MSDYTHNQLIVERYGQNPPALRVSESEPMASLLAPLYTLGLYDITWDCHVTRSFEVTSWSGVTYQDVLGNVPSYCCLKPIRYQTET